MAKWVTFTSDTPPNTYIGITLFCSLYGSQYTAMDSSGNINPVDCA